MKIVNLGKNSNEFNILFLQKFIWNTVEKTQTFDTHDNEKLK